MKFTEKQISAILWVIRIGFILLNRKPDFIMILAREAPILRVTRYYLESLLRVSCEMHPVEAIGIISKLDYQDKKYVSALLWSCFPLHCEIEPYKERLENLANLCDIPIMSWEEAHKYRRHLPGFWQGLNNVLMIREGRRD